MDKKQLAYMVYGVKFYRKYMRKLRKADLYRKYLELTSRRIANYFQGMSKQDLHLSRWRSYD